MSRFAFKTHALLTLAATLAVVSLATASVRSDPARNEPARGEPAKREAVKKADAAVEAGLALKPIIPVKGVRPEELRDNFEEGRGTRKHEAIDILAPRGTPVIAADDGEVAKLFTSKAGGITVYQYDTTGKYIYYYAHLDRYADGLKEGVKLRRGETLGYVGTTGNAPKGTPHLHFTIFRLGPERKWWKGTALNPYPLLNKAPDSPG